MKKVLFFAILSFIFLIYNVESYEMSVGISPFINASLSVTTNETTYYRTDTVDIINTLENKGNNESVGNLTTRLFAPNGSEIFREDWFDILLGLTSPEYYLTSYDLSSDADLGNYTVTSNFSYENKIANANTEFEFKEMPLTTVPPTEGEAEGEGEGEGEEETTTILIETTTISPTTSVITIEETTTTTVVVTMPAFVLMPYLVWIILVIILMITITVWMKVRKKPRKRRRLTKRKKQ